MHGSEGGRSGQPLQAYPVLTLPANATLPRKDRNSLSSSRLRIRAKRTGAEVSSLLPAGLGVERGYRLWPPFAPEDRNEIGGCCLAPQLAELSSDKIGDATMKI